MSAKATVREAERPEGFGPDDDPRLIDGEVWFATPLTGKATVVRASARCTTCWGAGMVNMTVSDEGERVRVTRPCGCVWAALKRPPETAPHNLKGERPTRTEEARVTRLQDEIDRAERELLVLVGKRENAVSVHAAERDALALRIDEAQAAFDETDDEGQNLADLLTAIEDERTLLREQADAVRGLLEEAGMRAEAQDAAIIELHQRLKATHVRINEVANRDGMRHRIDVQRRRVEKLRERLAIKLRDLRDAPEVEAAAQGAQ